MTEWRFCCRDDSLSRIFDKKGKVLEIRFWLGKQFTCDPRVGNSTLIRRVCATGVLNLSPCSGVGKLKKDTLFWSYHSIVLYCIVLYCIVLYCIVLCIVLYCIVLCIVLYCIVLYCIVLYCIVLYCIVLYCIALHCIALHCIVLYCIRDEDHVYALLI